MKSLFLATPCYAGMATASFVSSVLSITEACRLADVGVHVHLSANESLITRARNRAVHKFLLSDATHLLFFDADQGIDGQSIVEMLDLDLELVGAPVPMKSIDWDAVAVAARHHEPNIETAGPRLAINLIPGSETLELVKGCVEVSAVGTGCMLIRRDVIERMIEANPESMYVSDSPSDFGIPMHALFDTHIDRSNPLSPRYLSEDWLFCKRWRNMGNKVWLYLRPKVTHQGSYTFRGDVNRLFDPPEAHEWDDIPSLPDDNPQKRFHVERYEWAAKQIFGLKVANAPCGANYGNQILENGLNGRRITGYDRSAEAIDIGQKYGRCFQVSDMEDLSFSGYETLVCLEGLEHLKEPVRFLRNLAGSVQELVVSVPIIPTKHNNAHHLHDFGPDELPRILEALGWNVVRTQKQDEFVKEAVLMVYAVRP